MSTSRRDPYIWPTWIVGLLSGESHCEWAAWFRAHFRDYEKAPRSMNLSVWTAEHGAMVRERAEELRSAGYTVYVEDQNGFALRGQAATVGGKADIVAILENGDRPGPGPHAPYDALVIDCKSGKRRDKDVFQVLLYMLILPLAVPHCKGLTLRGELEYKIDNGGRVAVEPALLDDKVKKLIRSTIERVAGSAELPKVPSAFECRFCDLTSVDCQSRIDGEAQPAVTSDLW